MRLFILLHSLQAFPYSPQLTAEVLRCARNSYEHHSISGFLYGFGNENGLRAKVYHKANRVIISFRGTVLKIPWVSTGVTIEINRLVDNAMFKCCNSNECIQRMKSAVDKYGYIADSVLFTEQVMQLFPRDKIILTGHSLGASIAAIVGRITGLDVLAFSSPGEKHVSDHISNGDTSRILHLGPCSDPIYTGRCRSYLSVCRLAGYQIETRCHTGKAFCIGSRGPGSIVHHTAGWLEYLIYNGEEIVEMSTACEECTAESHVSSVIHTILNFLHII